MVLFLRGVFFKRGIGHWGVGLTYFDSKSGVYGCPYLGGFVYKNIVTARKKTSAGGSTLTTRETVKIPDSGFGRKGDYPGTKKPFCERKERDLFRREEGRKKDSGGAI